MIDNRTETIAAPATPPGCGGVGIVRISGPQVSSIMQKILGKVITAKTVHFCGFFTEEKEIIDKGLAIYFSAPNSFTGEDILELHGHGGQVVMDLLLQRVLKLGARLAKPGEFTERAFLNNKLDLVQVEALSDLINATSEQAARNATRSLQGEFSSKIDNLVTELIRVRADIEASIDFGEEDDVNEEVEIDKQRLEKNLHFLLTRVEQLKNSARSGVILRDGITVVIAGGTNAGKSSLLNLLSGQEMAIVTDIPGTTRDIVQVPIQLAGLNINLLDTAGLRDQQDLSCCQFDPIEREGIRRAKEEFKKADHLLFMIDATVRDSVDLNVLHEYLLENTPQGGCVTVLFNKIDLTGDEPKIVKEKGVDIIYISVKEKLGLDLLQEHLKCGAGITNFAGGFSARRRHISVLEKVETCLQRAINNMFVQNNAELIAEELRETQETLGEITGQVRADDILDKIFAEFCIGK